MKRVLFSLLCCVAIIAFITPSAEAVKYQFEVTSTPVSEKSSGTTYMNDILTVNLGMAKQNGDFMGIDLAFLNRGSAPIKIDWNQSAMIGADNVSYRIGVSGVPYADLKKGGTLPITIIPPGTSFSIMVFPIDGVRYMGGYIGWIHNYILPRTYKNALNYVGRGWKIYLPIEINKEVKNYTLGLNVSSVEK